MGLVRLASASAWARSLADMGPGKHRAGAMGLGLAGAGGLLLAAGLAPWPLARGTWPLGLVGAALVFTALERPRFRGRLAAGVLAGGGLCLPGLWWMRDFSLPGYVVATL